MAWLLVLLLFPLAKDVQAAGQVSQGWRVVAHSLLASYINVKNTLSL
jgi:hypothetical protein